MTAGDADGALAPGHRRKSEHPCVGFHGLFSVSFSQSEHPSRGIERYTPSLLPRGRIELSCLQQPRPRLEQKLEAVLATGL
jgi:hypothetical protein